MASPSPDPDAGSIRLFVPERLGAGASIALSEGQARYLGTVMRRTAGSALRLFNGQDGEWRAVIRAMGKRGVEVEAVTPLRPQEAEPDLWLLLSIIKRDALEWAVEKATELGVSEIHPVITARSQPARPAPERLRAIAVEAAEQSERLSVPLIHPPALLDSLLRRWPEGRVLTAAIERAGAAPPPAPGTAAGALLIGPEGGFDPGELDAMRRLPFIVTSSLGARILRAETAAVVGLALLQRHVPS